MSQRILIIDADEVYSKKLSLNLRLMGYEVSLAKSVSSGFQLAIDGSFDLVIAEIVLPDKNGLELCKMLRARPRYTPVLILTGKSDPMDEILSLKMEANDFIRKSADSLVLVVRIEGLLRLVDRFRSPMKAAPRIMRLGHSASI